MTDFFEETIRNYSGLSSETKPTTAGGDNVLNGSRWREVDTARVFHYNKSDDTWHQSGYQVDQFGMFGQYTPMRDFKVTEPFRLVGTALGASIDAIFWAAINNGAGSASGVASALATMSSGTANNGYGQISSVHKAAFEFAHPLQFRAAIRITDTTVAECTRRWGAFTVSTVTPQNGFYFEMDEGGVLSVNHVSGTSVTKVSSGAFNGDVSTYTMDTDVHACEIVFFTMGAWFYCDNTLIHTFIPTTALLAQTNDVNIVITSANSASGTTSGTIECWNAIIIQLGKEITNPVSFYQAGTVAAKVLKTGSGTLHNLAVSAVVQNAAITLYDNTAAAGTILWASGAMAARIIPFNIDLHGVPFYTGLTLTVATQSANATVIYE